jgi:hypothetical protein
MKRILRMLKLKEESGAALVIVAISMVALLGFTALTIDGGRLYTEKSKLQKTLDAAVLAGAQGIRTNQAKTIAREVSQKNGYSLSKDEELTVVGNEIKAEKEVSVQMTFAKALGMSETKVSAKAKAIVAPIKKADRIAPIAVQISDVPNKTIINCGDNNPGENHGNCGYLRIDGSGAKDLGEAIKNGLTYEIGQPVSTEPGHNTGPVGDAIEFLIKSDESKSYCQSASTANNSCERVINIVVIETWEGINGQKPMTPIGFASYWVDKYEDKKLYGKFIKMVSPGEIGSSTELGEYNLHGVRLVE